MNKLFSASVINLLSNRTLIGFKRPVYAGSQIFLITQTPRRETYYPCESLISRTFNGDYYTFYHNYFIFSKI